MPDPVSSATSSLIPGLGLGLAGVGALFKGINYFQANRDQKAALNALKQAQSIPYQKYTITPQLNNYYSGAINSTLNPQGLTAGEKAAFQSNVSQTVKTLASNATRGSGGNFSRFIVGALNPSVIAANNQLVAQDAGIRRANQQAGYGRLGAAVTAMQDINNRNVAQENLRKQMIEQYLGQAALQNKGFKANTLDSIGSDLLGGGLLLGLSGMDGGATGNKYLTVNPAAAINGGLNPNEPIV